MHTHIGISGTLEGNNTLILILSTVFGVGIGTLIKLDEKITWLGNALSKKFEKSSSGNSVAEAFITVSMLFCVGAMTVVGSLNAGMNNNEMLFTKSVLDFISSMMLAASLGFGVIFSAVFVFVYQSALALLSSLITPYLNSFAIAEMTAAGSLIIIELGLNILRITKIKVADFLPSIFLAPLFYYLYEFLSSFFS